MLNEKNNNNKHNCTMNNIIIIKMFLYGIMVFINLFVMPDWGE